MVYSLGCGIDGGRGDEADVFLATMASLICPGTVSLSGTWSLYNVFFHAVAIQVMTPPVRVLTALERRDLGNRGHPKTTQRHEHGTHGHFGRCGTVVCLTVRTPHPGGQD